MRQWLSMLFLFLVALLAGNTDGSAGIHGAQTPVTHIETLDAERIEVVGDDGKTLMRYRVNERYYGPEIRHRDWEAVGGKLVSAGGMARMIADERQLTVRRADYLYGGGGDVELMLSFIVERMGEEGTFVAHFNQRRRPELLSGFRVEFTRDAVVVFQQGREIARTAGLPMTREHEHRLTLATLAESFVLTLDGRLLAAGGMAPPYAENEGVMTFVIQDAGVSLTGFRERFIAHDVPFSTWQRADLLYEEAFGEDSWRRHWVCNGVQPEIVPGAFRFREESVSVLRARFEGPLAMDCRVTPLPTERFTAGVTDAIVIWMLDQPGGNPIAYMQGLPNASLAHYVPLPLYWVDFGGTNNVTTRLRKNPGRQLIRQFTDRPRLLARDTSYHLTVLQHGHWLEFWVDNVRWIQAYDPNPLTSGHMGFRAFVSGLEVSELQIWRIKDRGSK